MYNMMNGLQKGMRQENQDVDNIQTPSTLMESVRKKQVRKIKIQRTRRLLTTLMLNGATYLIAIYRYLNFGNRDVNIKYHASSDSVI